MTVNDMSSALTNQHFYLKFH